MRSGFTANCSLDSEGNIEMENIQQIYTWKDIDRIVKKAGDKIKCRYITDIDVYHDEVVVSLNDMAGKDEAACELKEFFGSHYDLKNDVIKYDLFHKSIEITWDADEIEKKTAEIVPLFENVIYRDNSYEKGIIENDELNDCPVIAFHSYKGGVGRTLSLLAFAKAWSVRKPSEKLLIIDSDIEAPGLTWLMEENGDRESQISYFDLLELIQSSDLDNAENFATIVDHMQLQTMKIDNGKTYSEHYFVPTYRYEEQLLDIYASPDSIVKGYKKKYILAKKLSELGKALGVSAVLVDLRAGISEFSAPLLFDPRVRKYIVSSTSYQSIKGTQLILKEICKGLPVTENSIIPNILLTMTLGEVDVARLKGELLQVYDEQEQRYTDNALIELPFASELVHLESLNQILDKLDGRDFYYNIYKLVDEFYSGDISVQKSNDVEQRNEVVNAIHKLAKNQINAELNTDFNVLMTKPISNLIKKFNSSVPQAIVIGAKGAGKTFLFRELLRAKKWETFCTRNGMPQSDARTYIIPFISPKNFGELNGVIHDAVDYFAEESHLVSEDRNYWYRNAETLLLNMNHNHSLIEWKELWKTCLLKAFNNSVNRSLDHVEEELKKRKINVLFVVDGLEEIFENTLDNDNEKTAIRALVQELINEIKLQYPHIGMLVFLRKDLSNNSIETNREQFEGQNRNYSLNWTHEEALKLALWLVNQAVPGFYEEGNGKVEDASKDAIKETLDKLWGLKLGKNESNEAYSSRWILAALSDFNAQLQARDIVRFLANATSEVGNETYSDRIIMPKEIKKAVQACSDAKIEEIKQEMKNLKKVIEKLEKAPESKKLLPFSSGAFDLTAKEELMMIQEGLLKIDDGKYYIPEIIRHSLKFKYEKGARPKVLSLLFK